MTGRVINQDRRCAHCLRPIRQGEKVTRWSVPPEMSSAVSWSAAFYQAYVLCAICSTSAVTPTADVSARTARNLNSLAGLAS